MCTPVKYFNFYFQNDLSCQDTVDKASKICHYLSAMFEYYFKPAKTDKVTRINICFGQTTVTENSISTTDRDYFILVDYSKIRLLSDMETVEFLVPQIQQAIIACAKKEAWDIVPFEVVFDELEKRNFFFREYYKKAIFSKDKHYKARIYFEFDYERSGTYVDFMDKSDHRINRVQFTPSGYSVISKSIGTLEWIDNEHVRIWNVQVPRAGANDKTNQKNYWIVGRDGEVTFGNIFADKHDPHALYQVGLDYVDGIHVLKDEAKGKTFIQKSANMQYKHALNWIKKNA